MPSFDQNTHLQDLKAYIPGRSISEIASAFDLAPAHIIKLGSNENPWGISPKALTEISKLDQSFNQKLSFYPDALSQMLTEELKKKFPEIGNAAIIAGNGMDNILEATARLLLSPGDKTIIHTPTFEYYEIVTKWAYAEPVFIETKAENNFKLNIEELLNQIDSKTKLIFLCNPNNPTGNSFEWTEIKEILQKAEKFGATVFLDEAYGEFAENSYINQVQHFPNLMIGRTFSKLYGLAAQRIGWGVIPHSYLDFYRKVQTPFSTNLLGLIAAKAALWDEEFIQKTISSNQIGKKYLSEKLQEFGFQVFPSQANFISFLAGKKFDYISAGLCSQLLKQGIIVRDASLFRGAPTDLVRISIGRPDQNEKVISAIQSLI